MVYNVQFTKVMQKVGTYARTMCVCACCASLHHYCYWL